MIGAAAVPETVATKLPTYRPAARTITSPGRAALSAPSSSWESRTVTDASGQPPARGEGDGVGTASLGVALGVGGAATVPGSSPEPDHTTAAMMTAPSTTSATAIP